METSSTRKKRRQNERYRDDPEFRERQKKKALDHYYANQEARREAITRYQYERKWQAIQVLGGVCMYPGCDVTHPAALQFHHRDPATKLFVITTKTLAMPKKYPWSVILEEIAKCDLLCANHHFILHSKWNPEWTGTLPGT